jgi:hypothetical protein
MSHKGNMFSVLHMQKHCCGAHASFICHLIHLQNVSVNRDHHIWINKWRCQGPENFMLQKIHDHNKPKYGHTDHTKGSAYTCIYPTFNTTYSLSQPVLIYLEY